MANEEKLPHDLIEEILSRVPPKSLVRFRTVSKRWNDLFDDKTFIKNHKATFQFILKTKSKIYSVSIYPKIVVNDELTLDMPDLESQKPKNLIDCDEFLICSMDKGVAVWNPWLNLTRWIKFDINQRTFQIGGIGYDSNNKGEERVYKTIGSYNEIDQDTSWRIHDFVSDAWKEKIKSSGHRSHGDKRAMLHTRNGVSLNGTVYWISYYDKKDPLYHLVDFDFSSEVFSIVCYLPCGVNHLCDALVLKIFEGDRFSLLKQCHTTKKIEIWVTDKINYDDEVVWMPLMTFSVPNLPGLVHCGPGSYSQPSYFIDYEKLVVCSCDETGRAWIYVLEENKLISKVKIDHVVDHWPLHCTCFPSWVPIPRGPREEAQLQV